MKHIKIQSDYSPDTYLHLTRTEDGDVVFKISGKGEMRIATNGGQFHGKQLVSVCKAIDFLITALSTHETSPSEEQHQNIPRWRDKEDSPCAGCFHRGCCGMLSFDTSGMDEEEIFLEHCVGCPCGEGYECNREEGCSNYEKEIT